MTKQKFIIGLGCSWTQGEGGYPEEIWKEYNGRPQISLRGKDDYHIRHYEHENSWVNVLCRDHFTDYTPINLGVKGIGNRAAVEQLHFLDRIDWENSEGIIILLLSGFERLDLPGTHSHGNNQDDGYSNGFYRHYKWQTAWPIDDHNLYWKAYAKELYSERFVATNQLLALLNLQDFAKSRGFKLVLGNAFNFRNEGIIQYFTDNTGNLANKFDWDKHYLHIEKPFTAFVQKLVELDGILPPERWNEFHSYYYGRDWPAEYLTNCQGAHPTIKGYKVIADEMATYIKYKGYA